MRTTKTRSIPRVSRFTQTRMMEKRVDILSYLHKQNIVALMCFQVIILYWCKFKMLPILIIKSGDRNSFQAERYWALFTPLSCLTFTNSAIWETTMDTLFQYFNHQHFLALTISGPEAISSFVIWQSNNFKLSRSSLSLINVIRPFLRVQKETMLSKAITLPKPPCRPGSNWLRGCSRLPKPLVSHTTGNTTELTGASVPWRRPCGALNTLAGRRTRLRRNYYQL